MRILTITTVFPYPPNDGTKIQIYQRVRHLSANNEITVLVVDDAPVPPEHLSALEEHCRVVVIAQPRVSSSVGVVAKVRNLIRSLVSGVPYTVTDSFSEKAAQWIASEVAVDQYDVIEADGFAAVYIQPQMPALKSLILHRVEDSAGRRELQAYRRGLGRLVALGYWLVNRRYQRELARRCDLCVALTPESAAEFEAAVRDVRVRACLSNGIDLEYFRFKQPTTSPAGACFVGKMDYQPNVDAVLYFHREIFPLVRKAAPDARFWIVGSKPTAAIQRLAQEPGVVVTGFVEDVRPYLREAGVAVVPARTGGGILNKVLEALALGVPVVTTSLGLEGLRTAPERDLLAADAPKGIADAVCRLLADQQLRTQLARNGRLFVEQHHRWDRMVQNYELELRGLLGERNSEPPPDGARLLNVLHLTSSNGFYGAERVITSLVEHSAPDRLRFHVANLEKKHVSSTSVLEAVSARGATATMIPCRGRFDNAAVARIVEIVRNERIDILHCHEPKSRLYALAAARKVKVALLATNHNWTWTDPIAVAVELLDVLILHRFPAIVAVSRSLGGKMARLGISARKISVIPNGVCPPTIDPQSTRLLRKSLGLSDGNVVIGTVGSLDSRKAQDLLLRAAPKIIESVPQAVFVLVGDGPRRGDYERLADQLGIRDRTILTGYRQDVEAFFSLMDVFVLTSKNEGTPMVILEAMAIGTPVVATAVGGVSDIIDDGRSGLLLRNRRPEELARLVVRVLQDRTFATELTGNAKAAIEGKFSARRMAERYEEVYRECLA